MRKFSRTLTFESLARNSIGESSPTTNRHRTSVTSRGSITTMNGNEKNDSNSQASNGAASNHQPLDARVPSDYANQPGLSGLFVPIKNDFSVSAIESADGEGEDEAANRYQDEAHWTRETREQVKRVRFIICTLALFGLALGLMSRLILNVSIVEMVKKPDVVPGEDLQAANESGATTTTTMLPSDDFLSSLQPAGTPEPPVLSIDPLIFAATDEPTAPVPAQPRLLTEEASGESVTENPTSSATSGSAPHDRPHASLMLEGALQHQATQEALPPNHHHSTPDEAHQQHPPEVDNLHFSWSKQDINIVLGSFYLGYAPGILFSGSLAQRYGAKWPLFMCVFGSAVINIFTPLIAQTSLNLLIGSRVALGLIQGSLLPCLYELFNRWLTQTESSIFAPLIKVSMPLGSLMGTLMPGILASLRLDWPNLFYIGGFLCLCWSLAWGMLATSLPQDNKFVGVNELNRIMRKKHQYSTQQATISDKSGHRPGGPEEKKRNADSQRGNSTPWLLIMTNPSVLALTLVKFTYNIGMDFIFLQLAVYLREVHNAPIETISAIASGGYCMQMLLIAFVGWLAKVVVLNHAFGLSTTKWRKAFQGGSNFLMALTYLVLAYASPDLNLAAALLLLVCFFWMFGAGGESMVPYDLSSEHPASIVGFAHSVSIFSGVALTAVCDMILGENTEDPENWSSLFLLLSGALAFGGLVFVLIVKAKPFLPGEKVPKSMRLSMKLQQVSSASQRALPSSRTSKLNGFK